MSQFDSAMSKFTFFWAGSRHAQLLHSVVNNQSDRIFSFVAQVLEKIRKHVASFISLELVYITT